MSYIDSLTKYNRRKTIDVEIGEVSMGSNYPIRIQTMLNTDTNNISATVEQSIKCIDAGSEYIRITAQGAKEAYNLEMIKASLRKKGYDTPIIADIHFNPKAAEIAANYIEKIRINPGNYTDKKRNKSLNLSDDEYKAEIERIRERFVPLLDICKKHKTAIRIGTNHGSLSDRIMDRFGDTPEGMAESAMEFLRICKQQNFKDVVLSMKASNTRIMVYATRLLVKKMADEDMYFPLHLGVTEAGDGEDGRVKSAVGIGALLADGIGDTIRVSLTEDPEVELPVAKEIVAHFNEMDQHDEIENIDQNPINPYAYLKRNTYKCNQIGGGQAPVVIACCGGEVTAKDLIEMGFNYEEGQWVKSNIAPDYIFGDRISNIEHIPVPVIVKKEAIPSECADEGYIEMESINSVDCLEDSKKAKFIFAFCSELDNATIQKLKKNQNLILLLESDNQNKLADFRAAVIRLINANCNIPVIFKWTGESERLGSFQLDASCDLGGLFLDGLGDGILLSSKKLRRDKVIETSFQILQATGDRITKTEYISCPSCGRTNFNLMEAVAKIKERTSHLKGLKIGIMGCIVNGPGEMADAHYGYVGAGKDKITLYKGQQVIERGIPSENAVDRLIELIKQNGDWVE